MDNPQRNQRYNPQYQQAPAEKAEETALLGSSKQPATFKLANGEDIQLGEVVRRAYAESGCATPEEWNALDEETREEYVASAVAMLDHFSDHTGVGSGDGVTGDGETKGKADDGTAGDGEPLAKGDLDHAPAKRGWFGRKG